jgi:hypothetical protein
VEVVAAVAAQAAQVILLHQVHYREQVAAAGFVAAPAVAAVRARLELEVDLVVVAVLPVTGPTEVLAAAQLAIQAMAVKAVHGTAVVVLLDLVAVVEAVLAQDNIPVVAVVLEFLV